MNPNLWSLDCSVQCSFKTKNKTKTNCFSLPTFLQNNAANALTKSTEKIPIRKVQIEERRKHHHFLSFRHSSSSMRGIPSGAKVSWPTPMARVRPKDPPETLFRAFWASYCLRQRMLRSLLQGGRSGKAQYWPPTRALSNTTSVPMLAAAQHSIACNLYARCQVKHICQTHTRPIRLLTFLISDRRGGGGVKPGKSLNRLNDMICGQSCSVLNIAF